MDKQDADGARPRVWTQDNLMGRMTVQFVALCYEDFLRERFREIRSDLEARNASGKAKLDDADADLLRWLKKTSFEGVLRWFDACDDFDVSTETRRRRWNAQTTPRDRRFLSLLMRKDA